MTEKNNTPGKVLRAAREAKALSPTDIAKEMRLSPLVIECIERDDYEGLGVRTFARGYLATYARIVDVSQPAIFELFDIISPAPEVSPLGASSVVEGAPVVNVTRERTTWPYSQKLLVGVGGFIVILFALIFHSAKSTTTDVKSVDNSKGQVSTATVAPIVIPAETTAAAPTQVAKVAVEKPEVVKASVMGIANPGSNTPFIRKPAGDTHVAVHNKKAVSPSPFTVTAVATPST